MPKRKGNLFNTCFTMGSLFEAYQNAARGKRKALSVQRFEANLGAELAALHVELHSGTYQPRPYRKFFVHEPKTREISAPDFRDTVVQHAIYAVIYPIFDRGFIHQNYGCRINKGTHRASDCAQRYLRQSAPGSYTLKLDIRRFYYRIQRRILRKLVERKLKDRRLVDLIMTFADNGDDKGLPIGSLLSQLLALIYLDALDHHVKRTLKVRRYVRYVDDFILFGLYRWQAQRLKAVIEAWLWRNLRLTLSKWSIAPTRKGVNFVGFRTWRGTRFVRKHSLYRFSKSLKAGRLNSLISILGNAKRSASSAHLLQRVAHERPDLLHQLPRSLCLRYTATKPA